MKRLFLLLSLAACGSSSSSDPDAAPPVDCDTPSSERLLPLAVGASWTYDVTSDTGTVSKQSTVEAYEDVGAQKAGVQAFRIRTEKIDGATVSWQEDLCDAIVRHREQSLSAAGGVLSDEIYEPHKLRVDETPAHTTAGATWTVTYSEITAGTLTKTETWDVVAVDEEVTVPAGTFTTIHLHRMAADVADADKQYWFAAGVGKVREEGGQLEELTAYEAP